MTAEEMREAESRAYARGATPTGLMENAGAAVSEFIKTHYPLAHRVVVVCGSGNNGGDGFVAARLLAKSHDVVVALTGSKDDIRKGPASFNHARLSRLKGVRVEYNSSSRLSRLLMGTDIVIDAMLGTGFHGAPRKDIADMIRQINAAHLPVVSVDVPSGLDSTTGKGRLKVRPSYTVTFHRMKRGLLLSSGNGKVIVARIGM